MSRSIDVILAEEPQRKEWDAFVSSQPEAACYHLYGWRDVVQKSFGHRTWYLACLMNGQMEGVLPLVQLKSRLFGNFMVSMPYFTYGGIAAKDAGATPALVEKAAEIARREGCGHIELRHQSAECSGLAAKASKVSMRLALPSGPDELWKSFPSKLRSQIRRPEKEGMYAAIGGEEALDDFYSVFSVNMRDLGTPVYSRRFFRNILDAFPDKTRICTVYTKDKIPVSSGFLLGHNGMLEIPWASSLKSFNRFSPNTLMYCAVLKYACESGYRTFDFGRSTPGEGTYKFKEQWGAGPVQLYWHYWLRDSRELPELNPANPKYRLAIELWKRLPINLTRLIGPAIVKNLP